MIAQLTASPSPSKGLFKVWKTLGGITSFRTPRFFVTGLLSIVLANFSFAEEFLQTEGYGTRLDKHASVFLGELEQLQGPVVRRNCETALYLETLSAPFERTKCEAAFGAVPSGGSLIDVSVGE